jgi:hypothetical protein
MSACMNGRSNITRQTQQSTPMRSRKPNLNTAPRQVAIQQADRTLEVVRHLFGDVQIAERRRLLDDLGILDRVACARTQAKKKENHEVQGME